MKSTIDLKPTLDFLAALGAHNNKAWFDQHRAAYEQAKSNFEGFVNAFIDEFRSVDDLGPITASDCTFRINRDIRFSKDKSPYKEFMGAHIVRGGRHSMSVGYYVQICPHDESFLASGLHTPSPQQLEKFRRTIARDARGFKRVIASKEFARAFALEGEKVKTAPQGYARDHPEIELLKMKQVLVRHPLTDKRIIAPTLLTDIVKLSKTLKPFVDYLNATTA